MIMIIMIMIMVMMMMIMIMTCLLPTTYSCLPSRYRPGTGRNTIPCNNNHYYFSIKLLF